MNATNKKLYEQAERVAIANGWLARTDPDHLGVTELGREMLRNLKVDEGNVASQRTEVQLVWLGVKFEEEQLLMPEA